MDCAKITADLRLIAAELAWMVKADTVCCGITQAQIPVIDFIGQKGPVILSDLSSAFPTDPSSLSRTVQTLVKLGLVERKENSADRRKSELILTKKGRCLHSDLMDNASSFVESLFENLEPAKTKSAVLGINILAKLLSNSRKNICCSFFQKPVKQGQKNSGNSVGTKPRRIKG